MLELNEKEHLSFENISTYRQVSFQDRNHAGQLR